MRLEIRDALARYSIPRGTVARLAGLHLPDLSGWLNGRTELNPIKIERVREVVSAIVEILQATAEPGQPNLRFDLRDPDNVARLIAEANKFKTQAAQAQLDSVMGEADSVFNLPLI
jgi:hypothetical protein